MVLNISKNAFLKTFENFNERQSKKFSIGNSILLHLNIFSLQLYESTYMHIFMYILIIIMIMVSMIPAQFAITCSKLTIETLEGRCEICSKLTIKTPKRHHWRRLVSLLLTLNNFTLFFLVFLLLTLSR